MSRSIQWVLLCEDTQHETFVRRFLKVSVWSTGRLRVEKAPPGKGSGEQFVRERFPKELAGYRSERNRVAQCLIVVRDGDAQGVDARGRELADACRAQGIAPQSDDDNNVVILIPTWNIETWLAYLNGATVDESRSNYPRLNRPRDCHSATITLFQMCKQQELRKPAPTSLEAACVAYRRSASRIADRK